tara:strand:+ start:1607 stop:2053 length:447 start_codon:yes stop_codon:yes gene_type:complete
MNFFKLIKVVFLSGVSLGLFACAEDMESVTVKVGERWYNNSQVELGKSVYNVNCIRCHLENAQGTFSWKKALEDGSYPPPPLNGTAHAWHHSAEVLLAVINEGGILNGGKMPAFKNTLSQEQQIAVIAYIQSFWPDNIYNKWEANQKH